MSLFFGLVRSPFPVFPVSVSCLCLPVEEAEWAESCLDVVIEMCKERCVSVSMLTCKRNCEQ